MHLIKFASTNKYILLTKLLARIFSFFKHYARLMKFRLSSSIVFSAFMGYLLGIDKIDLLQLLFLLTGGILIAGSANSFNQIFEKNHDALMKRTSERPLPSGHLSVFHATIFAIAIGLIGALLLNQINDRTAFFGLLTKSSFFGVLSFIIYVFFYTPLKRVSPIAIVVGAIPGAIPFLLGWVAATDNFGLAAGILFAIQFFWQFPHFIAISWMFDNQYKEAGFKMMIGSKKGKIAAFTSLFLAVLLTATSLVPWEIFNIDTDLQLSLPAGLVVLFLGYFFCFRNWQFLKNQDDESAKKVLLTSYIYLSLIQITYVIDRYCILQSNISL